MAKKEETAVNEVNTEKLKALQATLDKIEKDFGKGTIMKMGDKPIVDVPVISSGSIALDHALGIAVFLGDVVFKFLGRDSSVKTPLA